MKYFLVKYTKLSFNIRHTDYMRSESNRCEVILLATSVFKEGGNAQITKFFTTFIITYGIGQ